MFLEEQKTVLEDVWCCWSCTDLSNRGRSKPKIEKNQDKQHNINTYIDVLVRLILRSSLCGPHLLFFHLSKKFANKGTITGPKFLYLAPIVLFVIDCRLWSSCRNRKSILTSKKYHHAKVASRLFLERSTIFSCSRFVDKKWEKSWNQSCMIVVLFASKCVKKRKK